MNPFSKSFYRGPVLAIFVKIIFWPFWPLSLILIGVAYLIASSALQISNWNLNPAKAVQDIPEQSREYFVARTPKAKQQKLLDESDDLLYEHVDDEVIPYPASLYKHPFLQQERRNKKSADVATNRISTDKKKDKYRKFFSEGKQNIHNTELSELQNTYGETGFKVRMDFFNRTIEKEDDTILMGAAHDFDYDSDSDSSYSQ